MRFQSFFMLITVQLFFFANDETRARRLMPSEEVIGFMLVAFQKLFAGWFLSLFIACSTEKRTGFPERQKSSHPLTLVMN